MKHPAGTYAVQSLLTEFTYSTISTSTVTGVVLGSSYSEISDTCTHLPELKDLHVAGFLLPITTKRSDQQAYELKPKTEQR